MPTTLRWKNIAVIPPIMVETTAVTIGCHQGNFQNDHTRNAKNSKYPIPPEILMNSFKLADEPLKSFDMAVH